MAAPVHSHSRRRLVWLVFCLVMVAGFAGISIKEDRDQRAREALLQRVRATGIDATRYDDHGWLRILPTSMLRLIARVKVRVTLATPEQRETLKSLTAEGLPVGGIILKFAADSGQLEWLRREFPGVPLYEQEPGKTWLRIIP